MSINISSVYGNDGTWLKIDGYPTIATLSQDYTRPYFNHTIGAGLVNGNLKIMNASICPIAVDNGSTIANGNYVMLKTDNTIYKYNVQGNQTSIMFASSFRGYSQNTYYSQFISTTDTGDSTVWDSGAIGNVYGTNNFPTVMTSLTQPIVEFDYKKYVLAIIVIASKTNKIPFYDEPKIVCDLESYVKKYYNDYNYVNAVCVCPFAYKNGYYVNANISVTSDTSSIESSYPQNFTNFSYIPLGNVNTFTDYNGKINTAYTSLNCYRAFNITYRPNNPTTFTNTTMSVICGYANSDLYTDNMYNNFSGAVYIPNISNMFTVSYQDDRPDRIYTYYKVDDLNVFKEFCLKQTAYFGMYFTESVYDISNLTPETLTTKDTIYLGIIDNLGITHGEYAKGKDIKKYEQADWDSLKNQSPYDYTKRPDNSVYNDVTKLNTDRLFTVGSNVFTNVYAISRFTAFDLRKYLYSVVAPESTADTNTKQFLTNNPIDCIISCMQYPFNVIPDVSTTEVIRIGNTNAKSTTGVDLSGYIITDCLRVLDFGFVELYPFFGDFRDFEPYTELLLYIPYVGYIPLSTGDFMGTEDTPRNIGVKMIVDLITGSCNALIYKDDLVIQTANGTIGLQIPITGIQQADFTNAVHNAEYQTKLSLATTVGSLANATIGGISSGISGNGIGVASSLVNIANTVTTGTLTADNLQYNLQHTKVPFKVSGSASPACDFDNEQICRLIIKRPVLDTGYNKDIYAKTVGFACCINSTLSNFKGLTVCSNVNIVSAATATEKNMIHNILTKGVIL